MGLAEPWIAILMSPDPYPEFRRHSDDIGEETQILSSVMMMIWGLTWHGPIAHFC